MHAAPLTATYATAPRHCSAAARDPCRAATLLHCRHAASLLSALIALLCILRTTQQHSRAVTMHASKAAQRRCRDAALISPLHTHGAALHTAHLKLHSRAATMQQRSGTHHMPRSDDAAKRHSSLHCTYMELPCIRHISSYTAAQRRCRAAARNLCRAATMPRSGTHLSTAHT